MGKNGKRTGLAIAMAALALALAAPASASADKTVIGRQQLSGGTISFSGLCGVPPCTTAQHSVPSASVFVVTSPVNGTVTSWRFRTPAGGTMGEIYALRVLRSAANGTFTSVATSNNYTLPDTNDAVRGVAVAPATHTMFVMHGGDGPINSSGNGSVLAYDLVSEKVLWDATLSTGVDSGQVSPGNHTHAPWRRVNDVTTGVQKCLNLR